MKATVLIMINLLLLTTLGAQEVITQEFAKVSVTSAKSLNVKIVETTEACAFLVDHQWADEEDTRQAEIIFDDYAETKTILDELSKQGFKFAGYVEKDKCNYVGSTFPLIKTEDGESFFSIYTSRGSIAKLAQKQKAFKKVRRIYIAGFDSFKADLTKKADAEYSKVIESFQK